jgi:hypothetical protein
MIGVFAAILVACSMTHRVDDAGAVRDPIDGGRVIAVDAGHDAGARTFDAGVAEPPPGAIVCGGEICADGQACCLATLDCFDPSDAAACELPRGAEPGACASNADCAEGESCEALVPAEDFYTGPPCGGTLGRCVAHRAPEECAGLFGEGVCGCDGRTYADPCEASRAGVRVGSRVPCGESVTASPTDCDDITQFCTSEGYHCDRERGLCVEDDPLVACGLDAQCPPDQFCCFYVGTCMRDRERCFVPPAGTYYPCLTNEDCTFEPERLARGYVCVGDTCGGPGVCVLRERECGGVLDEVCGCDGMTYTNACWASLAGVRIDYERACR